MTKKRGLFGFICVILIITVFTIGCFENTNDQDDKNSIILIINCNNEKNTFTLDELENIESYSDTGRYIKTKLLPDSIEISDSHEYTGIRLVTLLEQTASLPDNYYVSIVSSDDRIVNFTKDEIFGNIDIYDENGEIISSDGAVMLLAYIEDGKYYSEIDTGNEIGSFRVAFVGDDIITSSSLWSKMVVSIEIISI